MNDDTFECFEIFETSPKYDRDRIELTKGHQGPERIDPDTIVPPPPSGGIQPAPRQGDPSQDPPPREKPGKK